MLTPIKPKNACITQIKKDNNTVYLISESGILRIQIFCDDVFRVSFTCDDEFNIHQDEEFLKASETCNYDILENENEIFIFTKQLKCKIIRQNSSVNFIKNNDGIEQVLFRETPYESHILEKFDSFKCEGQIKTEEIKTADGIKKRILSADKIFDKTLYHTKLNFILEENEKIFGLGQAEHGLWDLSHSTQYLNQANKKIAIPFFVSSKGYGVLFSTKSPAIFKGIEQNTSFKGLQNFLNNAYFYTTADYYLDYFFISPEHKADIVKRMRTITGKATLPPKWAFGYVQSQERYETQKEILDTVKEFKKRNIPLSCIVLDWLSWEDGMWGQKSFDKSRFPQPDKMIEALSKDNVHFMISIWPSMNEKCDNYKEMYEQKCLLNGQNICNSFDKKARALYWKQAREGLANFGVESWWCDSSEPMTPEWNHLTCPPEEIQFNEYVQAASDSMPLEKSNSYGFYHAMGMYEGQKQDFPERRMIILTRSGVLGSQKYGVTLWSGDTSATWKTLQNQMLAAIHFSLSGIPYWTFDIGGFFVKKGINWYWNGDYDNTIENNGYKELYTRWFQLGTFLPMLRAHGTDCRREPWAFENKENNVFYETIVNFIKLRYKLLPYIYSVAASIWKDDEQFIRPLFTQFNDANCIDICTQFMFGPNIMVCPVIQPMYYDKQGNQINAEKFIKVYLPSDCSWYDWWTNQIIEGGKWITCDADITKIPLFVKAGTVIPVDQDNKTITLRFPDSNGNCEPFELYEDDGKTNEYLNGKYKIYKVF